MYLQTSQAIRPVFTITISNVLVFFKKHSPIKKIQAVAC